MVAPHDLHGPVIVGFERNVRLWRYDLSKGLDALPSNIPIGPWVNGLNDNQQIEAVTLLEPNTLAVFAENPASGEENIRGALEFYPGGPRRLMTRNFRVAPRPPFAVTSAATAPEGDVLLLERRASLAGGNSRRSAHHSGRRSSD